MNPAKLYVGNLSYDTNENGIRDFFSQFGNINEVKLISDFQTGRSKGFAFITFETEDEGKSALKSDGEELDGRRIKVSVAKENTRRSGGGSRGGDRGGDRGGNFR